VAVSAGRGLTQILRKISALVYLLNKATTQIIFFFENLCLARGRDLLGLIAVDTAVLDVEQPCKKKNLLSHKIIYFYRSKLNDGRCSARARAHTHTHTHTVLDVEQPNRVAAVHYL